MEHLLQRDLEHGRQHGPLVKKRNSVDDLDVGIFVSQLLGKKHAIDLGEGILCRMENRKSIGASGDLVLRHLRVFKESNSSA